MNYPNVLKIEITNHCNAACVFCNNSEITNKQNMPLWMVDKIINTFPEAKQIQPQWFGEPLIHPEFGGIINICKQAKKQIVFYTNASLIDNKYEALKRLNKKDKIIISLEGADKQTYESIRKGLSWERLLKNIELLKKLPVRKVIRMTICKENEKTITKEIKFWKKKTGWKIIAEKEKPLLRHRGQGGKFVENKCSRPVNHFTVSVHGIIKLCCVDYQNDVKLGQITKDSDLITDWEDSLHDRHCDHGVCKKCLFQL